MTNYQTENIGLPESSQWARNKMVSRISGKHVGQLNLLDIRIFDRVKDQLPDKTENICLPDSGQQTGNKMVSRISCRYDGQLNVLDIRKFDRAK